MRNTITSKQGGYVVKEFIGKASGRHLARVSENNVKLMLAEVRTMKDYQEEKIENECFIKYEVFTDTNGIQWIYWGDTEINADYLTRV